MERVDSCRVYVSEYEALTVQVRHSFAEVAEETESLLQSKTLFTVRLPSLDCVWSFWGKLKNLTMIEQLKRFGDIQ